MRRIKKLLSLGLAVVLAFCSLSLGMAVHADLQEIPAREAFESIQINGKAVDLEKCGAEYIGLNFPSATAKIEWKLKSGWELSDASYAGEDSVFRDIQSGDEVSVPKKEHGWAILSASSSDGGWCSVNLYLLREKTKLNAYPLWKGETGWLTFNNLFTDPQVVSIKSSDTGVIQAKKADKLYDCKLVTKKTGKSKITVTVKINGEKKSFSATYTVKKYPNALTSLKVGGKKVDLKKKPFACSAKGSKVKVEFKAAKGWKLSGAGYYDPDKEQYVTIKSGGTVKVPKKGTTVYIALLNKNKEVFEYTVKLKR